MSPQGWGIEYAGSARRDLRRLDPPVRTRIVQALERVSHEPTVHSQLVRLRGRPDLRLRVGDWRAIVALDVPNRTIRVKRVLPRGRAYER